MIPSTLIRQITFVVVTCFLFAVSARGQSSASTWEVAPVDVGVGNSPKRLYVVTKTHPTKRHTCEARSVSTSEIVCEHHGRPTIYKAEDVAAIIEPGEHSRWHLYSIGFLAASGLTAWGTAVVASICLPCAIAPGFAAFFLFWMAPAMAMGSDGDSPDKLLYIAPGQTLRVKLH